MCPLFQTPFYPCLMYLKKLFPPKLFDQEKENSYMNSIWQLILNIKVAKYQ